MASEKSPEELEAALADARISGYLRLNELVDASYYQGDVTIDRETGETGFYATQTHTVWLSVDEIDVLHRFAHEVHEEEQKQHDGK